MKKLAEKIPLLLCVIFAFAICIKGLREPDVWWQIRTGDWIVENGRVPNQDIFSYTYNGTPWINIKWGSEVLFAMVSKLFGAEHIFLIQAFVAVALLLVLYKICQLLISDHSSGFIIVFAMCAAPMLLICEYRFNGRPEMFSHLLSVVFLWLLMCEQKKPSWQIWLIVPLQIVWANLHEAFGIGIVLTALFAFGNLLEWFVSKKRGGATKVPSPIKWFIVLLVQVVSVAINPYGFTLLTKPLNILGQVYENKFTTELFDFTHSAFWQWNVYALLALLSAALLVAIYLYRKSLASKQKTSFVIPSGASYLLVLVSFFYLASTAYRNVIFLALMSFPVIVYAAHALLSKYLISDKTIWRFRIAASTLLAAGYIFVVSGKYYNVSESRDSYGLQVLNNFNPIETSQFIKQNFISGKCFSDYLTSSYLLWSLRPDFKTFIDLRDLDVFPSDFFNHFAEVVTFPQEFAQLDSTERFDYIVLYRPQFNNLHYHLYNNSRFRLAHVDAVAAVYVSDSFETSGKAIPLIPTNSIGYAISKLLNPFYQPQKSEDNNAVISSYYLTVGDYDKATKYALHALTADASDQAYQLLGEINYQKQQYLQADSFYRIALQLNGKNAAAWLGLGATYFQQQNYKQALQSFEQAMTYDKQSLNARLFAAECCKYYINLNNAESSAYLNQAIEHYIAANRLNPDNPSILMNTGLLYYKKNDCSKATKYLVPIKDFEGLSTAERKTIAEVLARCGA